MLVAAVKCMAARLFSSMELPSRVPPVASIFSIVCASPAVRWDGEAIR